MDVDLEVLLPLKPVGGRSPLYCVHPVSGSAYAYAGLARLLDDRPVYGFEAPGFDNEREPVGSLTTLSTEYVAALREFQPEGPYHLAGWSLGGVLAFDMAQRLTAAGCEVARLVIVDAAVPTILPVPTEKAMMERFITDLAGINGTPVTGLDELFAGLPADAEQLLTTVVSAGLLPEDIDVDFLAERYSLFRTHLRALFNYEATGPYGGPVTLIMAAETPAEFMRWGTVADDVEEHTLNGDHYSIWTGESLVRMSEIIAGSLDLRRRAGGTQARP